MRRWAFAAALLASCTGTPVAVDASMMDASASDASMDAAARTPPIFGTPTDAAPTDAEPGCIGETFCPGPIPADPVDLVPAVPPCLPDGGATAVGMWGPDGDPCLHYVDCVDGFAVTYIGGRCVLTPDTGVAVDGGGPWAPMWTGFNCIFDEPPTFEYCFGGCWVGTAGRCLNPGPTAP